MNQIDYTASILARIGLMFPPDSEEHRAIRDAMTLMEEKRPGDNAAKRRAFEEHFHEPLWHVKRHLWQDFQRWRPSSFNVEKSAFWYIVEYFAQRDFLRGKKFQRFIDALPGINPLTDIPDPLQEGCLLPTCKLGKGDHQHPVQYEKEYDPEDVIETERSTPDELTTGGESGGETNRRTRIFRRVSRE